MICFLAERGLTGLSKAVHTRQVIHRSVHGVSSPHASGRLARLRLPLLHPQGGAVESMSNSNVWAMSRPSLRVRRTARSFSTTAAHSRTVPGSAGRYEKRPQTRHVRAAVSLGHTHWASDASMNEEVSWLSKILSPFPAAKRGATPHVRVRSATPESDASCLSRPPHSIARRRTRSTLAPRPTGKRTRSGAGRRSGPLVDVRQRIIGLRKGTQKPKQNSPASSSCVTSSRCRWSGIARLSRPRRV